MPSLSVDTMNLLIFRYLLENGFENAAYTFGLESSIEEVEQHFTQSSMIPNGALVNMVNKGIMFAEAEEECASAAINLTLMEAVLRLNSSREKDSSKSSDEDSSDDEEMEEDENEDEEEEEDEDEEEEDEEEDDETDKPEVVKHIPPKYSNLLAQSKVRGGKVLVKSRPIGSASSSATVSTPALTVVAKPKTTPTTSQGPPPAKKPPVTAAERKIMIVAQPEEKRPRLPKKPVMLEPSNIKFLSGHVAEAFICSWSPTADIVASGSGDSTGRLWYLRDADTTPAKALEKQCRVLKHAYSANMAHANNQVNHDVTSLDWSYDGSKLATGCYDGYARIWTKEGVLQSSLEFHKGPIFAVKWNNTGDFLVTAGVDRSTVVWNADGTRRQDYTVHDSSALDVDWVARDAFASCSTDKKIVVCRVDDPVPIQTLFGHVNEVNAIRYDSHSDRIASCSDDKTLKIWSINQSHPIYSFSDHSKEIYTLRWSPIGHTVASASFDHTVRLFDVNAGKCVCVLEGHTDPVYSVTFSPDGKYIASGCFDRSVFIWHVQTGNCVAKYVGDKNDGGIFEVNWSHTGNHLAASASDGKIILMDIRKVIRESGY